MSKPMVTVIGNIFVDIKGGAFRPVHKDAKNVGRVQIVHGGVGRNVVHNLAVLGARSRFISSYTAGGLGDEVASTLVRLGVDTTYLKSYPENGMGVWLAVLQPDGELVASISEQPHLEHQETTVLSTIPEALVDTHFVALDVGISKRVTEHVVEACNRLDIPVFGVVGNLDTVERYPETLSGFHTFVCNAEEAEILAKQPVTNPTDAEQAATVIQRFGCSNVVITLAEQGCVMVGQSGAHTIPSLSVDLVDSTGAGDAFFAGLLFAFSEGDTLVQSCHVASKVAATVVTSSFNTLVDGIV